MCVYRWGVMVGWRRVQLFFFCPVDNKWCIHMLGILGGAKVRNVCHILTGPSSSVMAYYLEIAVDVCSGPCAAWPVAALEYFTIVLRRFFHAAERDVVGYLCSDLPIFQGSTRALV